VIEGDAGYHRVCTAAAPDEGDRVDTPTAAPVESDQPEALTCQELLRTLGTLLDECGGERAVILLSPDGAEVISAAWRLGQQWPLDAIAAASALQRRWRVQPPERPLPPGGLRWSLRVVGAELDALGPGSYTITVRPDRVQVQSPAGYERTFDILALKRRAYLAPYRRGQFPARPAGDATPASPRP
jgi:hypothetical protein